MADFSNFTIETAYRSSVAEDGKSYFSMGPGTPRVPFSMHKRHREALVKRLRADLGATSPEGIVVFLEGGKEIPVYDTDTNWDFKQESNFQWLFGVREPDVYGALDLSTGRALLFCPRLPQDYEKWVGVRRMPDWFKQTYEVDDVFFSDEIPEVLNREFKTPRLWVYHGVNRDSDNTLPTPKFSGSDKFEIVLKSPLWDALAECRVIKDADEVAILEFVNDVSSDAHVAVMRGVRPNTPEFVSEAEFRHFSFLRGCARTGYSCICPSGPRCAVLHYGYSAFPNAEEVKAGEMKLHDMGAEYHCYTADVTISFPVGGRFTEPQRVVYEAVWEATLAVERAVRPGVCYKDMHRLAQRTLLERMVAAGLFQGDIAEMEAAHLMSFFMPHGLGHGLGLDVHDVGGYAPGTARKDDPTIHENLRLGRDLMEGMVLTVEPGFYFVGYLVRQAMQDPNVNKFIVPMRLGELMPVGGVRIEDDVLITKDGCRVLTRVPRTVSEIEIVMAGGPWEARAQPYRVYHGEGAKL